MCQTKDFYYFCTVKMLFIIIGVVSLVLGVAGIFLPILPTTPFLLLSATLFMHSSPKLYDRLIHHKYLGEYIRNYRENKTMPRKAKISALVMLWVTMSLSIFCVVAHNIYIQVLLFIIAVAVSWHIVSMKSDAKE